MKNPIQKHFLRRLAENIKRRKQQLCSGHLCKTLAYGGQSRVTAENYVPSLSCAVGDMLVYAGEPVKNIVGKATPNTKQYTLLKKFFGVSEKEVEKIMNLNDDAPDDERNEIVADALRQAARDELITE